jgi:hypothetical protein
MCHSGCICSIIRFRYIDGLTQVDDFFWNAVNIAIWSTIEAGASIIAGCLATLRPLLKCMVGHARRTSSITGCVKQISRSLRSGSTGNSSSNASTIPKHNTRIRNARSALERQDALDMGDIDTPTFLEFLALPDHEVIQMDSYAGQTRDSTDAILSRHEQSTLEFPWPVQLGIKEERDRKRQTVHGHWMLQRGTASDGRTFDRPLSAPITPGSYDQIGTAV